MPSSTPCYLCPLAAAGKRDLPAPLRNRFTEMWVGEPPQVRCLICSRAGAFAAV